jgi:flagellar hook-basal body complex protein FliE
VTVEAIAAVGPAVLAGLDPAMAATPAPAPARGFAAMLGDGIDRVSDKLVKADDMVRTFAIDDTIPVHQVTFALEEARLSLELMLQVRGRLLDGYQQIMNMQL